MKSSNKHALTLKMQIAIVGALFGITVFILGGFILFVLSRHQPLAASSIPADISSPAPLASPTEIPREVASATAVTPSLTLIFPPTVVASPTETATLTPPATVTPSVTPSPNIPPEAAIPQMMGHPQDLPLSCEASSAVDWAAFFGYSIDELEFFEGIPVSDNPEKGFVGDVNGKWGQIPPRDYGVHAEPVAERLRDYGVSAQAVREMSLQALKAEIAAGRPVMVWVASHVYRGTPIPYTASDGETVIVAKFEHTVIVTGYDEYRLTFLDGDDVYQRPEKEFLRSWGVLGNLGIIWGD